MFSRSLVTRIWSNLETQDLKVSSQMLFCCYVLNWCTTSFCDCVSSDNRRNAKCIFVLGGVRAATGKSMTNSRLIDLWHTRYHRVSDLLLYLPGFLKTNIPSRDLDRGLLPVSHWPRLPNSELCSTPIGWTIRKIIFRANFSILIIRGNYVNLLP